MVFLHPQPDAEELHRIYQNDYYRSWGLNGQGTGDEEAGDAARLMKQGTFGLRLKRLAGVTAPGRVLDVGCATGFFLEVADRAGWDVHGVELSRYAADEAKRRFGERVFNGTLEEAGFAADSFALVTLSDILEHIPSPRAFLAEVKRILAPGGRVMIVTPNVTSLSAHLMGRRWSHFKAEHLHYFAPHTITRLLTECGFTVDAREPAAKCLNLAYIHTQFRVYPHALMTPISRMAATLVPERLQRLNIPLYCGEMLVLARKGLGP
jgi:2-polyprenyl-3-methyl-5-hydroxy-6-metoxy-1,4-benzoquinol methylase